MPKRKLSKKGITIVGNPGEVTLHEAMEAVADWLDYEADVVENAADEIDDPDIAEAAEDQAEAMREASDELEDAADAARETAAEVFTETGEPSADKVGDSTPEGDVIGGNPVDDPKELSFAYDFARAYAERNYGGEIDDSLLADFANWYVQQYTEDESVANYPVGDYWDSWTKSTESGRKAMAIIRGNPDELPIETNLPPETSSIPDEPPRPLHWYKRPIGRRS